MGGSDHVPVAKRATDPNTVDNLAPPLSAARLRLRGSPRAWRPRSSNFYVTPRSSNTTSVLGSDTGGDPVCAYTARPGNGLSATISAEDTSIRRTACDLRDGGCSACRE
jgi:hypothetical protein